MPGACLPLCTYAAYNPTLLLYICHMTPHSLSLSDHSAHLFLLRWEVLELVVFLLPSFCIALHVYIPAF
jgi:hypothetical protein